MTQTVKLIALLASAAWLLPAAALAQNAGATASTRLDLAGDAPNACVLRAPSASGMSNAAITTSDQRTTQILVSQLVDPTTAVPRDASINLSFPLICNGAHRLSLTTRSGALILEGPQVSAPGFRTKLVYTISADWAGLHQNANSDSGAAPIDLQIPDGSAGVVNLLLSIPGGGDPLIAGAYSDVITIELQPAS